MQVVLEHFSQADHNETRVYDLDINNSTTLYQLLNKIAKLNPDYYFGPEGVEPFHCISLDGNRIIRPNDDVFGLKKITVVPFVDGG